MSEADVEDLTQQVFLLAHRDLGAFRGESSMTTWLYGVAARAVLMHFRSWRRRERLLEALAHFARLGLHPPPTAEEIAAGRQALSHAWRCLAEISPKKRVVFVLHEIQGLSGKEIAEALELKEATVWTRLHHARRELLARMRKAGWR